jgi:hypothetical protein
MSADSKKSMGGTTVLILLGLIALVAGPKWLVVLIPAAVLVWYLVWYSASSILRTGRN